MRASYTSRASEIVKKLHPLVKKMVREAVELLQHDPYQGKPLQNELLGYRSCKIEHYRLIYKIHSKNNELRIFWFGPRSTVYKDFGQFLQPS